MMGLSKYLKYDNDYSVSGYSNGNAVTVSFLVEGDMNNLVTYSTKGADPRTIFVIRDSFALGMMPYLSSQFNNCHTVLMSNFTGNLLAQCPSDIVVVEVVERYLDYLFVFSVE